MTTTVVTDILAATRTTVRPGETPEEFSQRIARKANDLTEDKWEALEEASQIWINSAVEALSKRRPVPLPPGIEELFTPEEEAQEEAAEKEIAAEIAEEEENSGPTPTTKKAKVKEKKAAPAKKAAAKKAAAKPKKGAKKATKAVGRKGNFTADAVIEILADANPFRDGSKGAEWFAKYKPGMKVADAIEAGIPRSQIRWDLRQKHIVVE